MRQAVLVKGLITERVRAGQDVRMASFPDFNYTLATDGAVVSPVSVKETILPIIELCRVGKPNIYVAYSEEVEELLGIPIRTIKRELDEARIDNQRLHERIWAIRDMSLWKRLMFLFHRMAI